MGGRKALLAGGHQSSRQERGYFTAGAGTTGAGTTESGATGAGVTGAGATRAPDRPACPSRASLTGKTTTLPKGSKVNRTSPRTGDSGRDLYVILKGTS